MNQSSSLLAFGDLLRDIGGDALVGILERRLAETDCPSRLTTAFRMIRLLP